MLSKTKRRIIDVGERVLFTFIGAFAAVYIAAFAAGEADIAFLRDPGLFDKAKAAGIVATLALAKGVIGTRIGDKGTGSIVPSNKSEEVVVLPYVYSEPNEDEVQK